MKSLETLYQLLKDDGIEIDTIELAESLWLSKYISKTKILSSVDDISSPLKNETTEKNDNIENIDETPQDNLNAQQFKKQKRKTVPLHPISKGDNKNSLPFRTPLVSKLYKDNDLIYAFRHFRQKIVSLKKTKLDEEKIADYIAKTDIFRPFYKKSYEKRFQILFMVDSSESMKIWENLIGEFMKGVKNYHIFKEVKIYYLYTDNETPQLFNNKNKNATVNPKWYKHCDQNTLCFIFSDMLSKSWSSGELLKEITLWQNYVPLSIIQMLPQRLWNATKLIDASMGKMSHRKQFTLNKQILSRVEEILIQEEQSLANSIKIPILNFDENSIDAYGKVMRSLPKNRIDGALFEQEDFRGEYQFSKEIQNRDANTRLKGFYKYASTQAKELVELLAVVPLSLPIIQLVQKKLLAQSNQEHLSEVFMSNIIDKEQKVDGFYQFSKYKDEEKGVREELIKKIGAKKAFQTIVKLSEVVQKQGGVFDFLAYVVNPDSLKEDNDFSEIDREFARISVSVLYEMGGKYYELADSLVEYLDEGEEDIEVVIPESKRFMLGDEKDVVCNYDFEMGQYPITVGEFRNFIKNTGYITEAERMDGAYIHKNEEARVEKNAYWDNPYFKQTENNPVVCVSIRDIDVYIKWLNMKTGEEYRLPSGQEWEFTCRAGSNTKWYFGDDAKELDKYAWYYNNNNIQTYPIRQKLSNDWNFYDMHGHIWEWCLSKRNNTILKGGSWMSQIHHTYSSSYSWNSFFYAEDSIGFRLAKTIKEKKENLYYNRKPKMIKILNSLSIDTIKIPNKNYEMGKYPITIAEYMHFSKDTDSHYPEWYQENPDKYKKMNLTDNAPIIGVDWYDSVAYCKWLSEKTGKRYRLPSEEEWEYSCRANTTSKWFFGDDEKELDKYAFYDNNSNKTTHIVGEKLANPWGLYDVYGNVWEWCDSVGEEKILKGGSFEEFDLDYIESNKVVLNGSNHRSHNIGFRILREYDEVKVKFPIIIESSISPDIGKIDNSFTFKAKLSSPLPDDHSVYLNFDNLDGGWFEEAQDGGHCKLNCTYTDCTLDRIINVSGNRRFRMGIFKDDSLDVINGYSKSQTFKVNGAKYYQEIQEIKSWFFENYKKPNALPIKLGEKDLQTFDELKKAISSQFETQYDADIVNHAINDIKEEYGDIAWEYKSFLRIETKDENIKHVDGDSYKKYVDSIINTKIHVPANGKVYEFEVNDEYYNIEMHKTSNQEMISATGATHEGTIKFKNNKHGNIEELNKLIDEDFNNEFGLAFYFIIDNEQEKKNYLNFVKAESEMEGWFFENYDDPVNFLLYETKEGDFQYLYGGPYGLDEVLYEEFEGKYPDEYIKQVIENLEQQYGDVEWAKKPNEDKEYVESDDPYDPIIRDQEIKKMEDDALESIIEKHEKYLDKEIVNISNLNIIKSQIAGKFKGWEGETIFKLMNGQIWKQSKYAYHYTYKFMPNITIYKSDNRYKLKVEGNSQSVEVERIK